jgi:hypothetical protein
LIARLVASRCWYSKGQKNDFRDAEAIAEAVQRPMMKFVATKTAEQLDLQALHRVRERLVSQRSGIINQIRAFLLERGIAVRQGLRFLRAELPGILAARSDVLSPRMLRLVEDLAGDWRRLDARIEDLSSEIEALAQQDQACVRLMTVPGIGPIISSAMVAAIGRATCSPKAATSVPGSGWSRNKSRRETAPSSAAYQSAAIVIRAPCSSRRPGSCWSNSGQSIGSAIGSSRGSRRQRNYCTTMCSPLRWPTSSPASPGRFPTRDAPSRASRPMRWRPDQRDPRAVLGAVKAWPGRTEARGKASATASLDGPCARVRRGLIQLAWRFLMFQKDSALARWYRTRTEGPSGGRKTTMIVALARKLLIALWRLVTTGEVPDGVEFRPAA